MPLRLLSPPLEYLRFSTTTACLSTGIPSQFAAHKSFNRGQKMPPTTGDGGLVSRQVVRSQDAV